MDRHSRRRKNKGPKSRSQSLANVEEGPIFEVKTSKIMGRYMVSRRELQPGNVILSEEPLVVGPCTGGKVQCLGCYQVLEGAVPYVNAEGIFDWQLCGGLLSPFAVNHIRFYDGPCTEKILECNGCGWLLCSQKCPGLHKKHGHTLVECAVLQATKSSRFLTYNDHEKMRPHFHAIVPLRCLLLKTTDHIAHQQLLTMETHNQIRRDIPDLWEMNQTTVVNRIRDEWGLKEYSEEEVHSICGILEINSFEIGQHGVSLRGLYPSAFLMSHDCIPNTNHCDEEDSYRLTVRASTRIAVDQPITLSYAYTLQSTLKRREHLLENKFFECQCQRCSDPTEIGTYTGALLCPKCKNGIVLSTNPLDQEASWSCQSESGCPGYTISAKSMQRLITRISEEVEGIDSNDVKAMEGFLQKYRNVLHPTHYLCLGVKLSLSQLYGKIGGYLIHELDENLLMRKLKICEEIIKVFDIIEPGYTRLRGVTLYEMHAPLMILLTRQFESQNVSKNELRAKLKRVVKCLEEASATLSFEPESSAEGLMGVAAKSALIKIRDWEKILGRL